MYKRWSDLVVGCRIKIIKEFKDFDDQVILLGSEWTFKEYTYFPYDGGYTFYFDEGIIRMAEISEPDYYVFSHASEFFVTVPDILRDTWTSR